MKNRSCQLIFPLLTFLSACSLLDRTGFTFSDYDQLESGGYVSIKRADIRGVDYVVSIERVKISGVDTAVASVRSGAAAYFMSSYCQDIELLHESEMSISRVNKLIYMMEFSCVSK